MSRIIILVVLLFSVVNCRKWTEAGKSQSTPVCSVDARQFEEGFKNSYQVSGAMDGLCKTVGKDRATGNARCKPTKTIGDLVIESVVEIECK